MNNKLTQAMVNNTLKVKMKTAAWLQNKKSNQTTDEGFWTYAKVVIGIIALAIFVTIITTGSEAIGQWFLDATNGTKIKPDGGWGGTTTP